MSDYRDTVVLVDTHGPCVVLELIRSPYLPPYLLTYVSTRPMSPLSLDLKREDTGKGGWNVRYSVAGPHFPFKPERPPSLLVSVPSFGATVEGRFRTKGRDLDSKGIRVILVLSFPPTRNS